MLNKIDIYIIKKFLSTFFFTLVLIICIIIVFDLSEKLEEFIEKQAPLKAIIFDYYLNYAPYLANKLSPLFIFISVIFFTSKMASNSEIVAILASGISFKRLLRPFLICAFILAGASFYLNNFLIPEANKDRLAFEEQYYRNKLRNYDQNIHMKINDNTFIYMTNFVVDLNLGNNFSIERFNDKGELEYKLLSDNVKWDTTSNKWSITNYVERHIDGLKETIKKGTRKDTVLDLKVEEFKRRANHVTTMDLFQLNDYIEEQTFKGSQQIVNYELERQQRTAFPFATIVLTLIGVSVSSRKYVEGLVYILGLAYLLAFHTFYLCKFHRLLR